MKKLKIALASLLALTFAVVPLFIVSASADDTTGSYEYKFDIHVDNPVNKGDMDKDAVNDLYFEFYYRDKNGYGSEQYKKFDMSWNGKSNNNSDTLWSNFIRGNDKGYDTEMTFTFQGKLTKMHIKLNMDGGERLSFRVNNIYCNGKKINTNSDYVSSCYYDSNANIYCSMENSVIDRDNSPYFATAGEDAFTQTAVNKIVNTVGTSSEYVGKFKDQYNAVIDLSVLKNCVGSSDGDINQYYSHADEESMYKYTLWFHVENALDTGYADKDEVETFYIDFYYKTDNGYGEEKTYRLDMQYDKSKGGNKNQNYLAYFEADNDDDKYFHFDVWVPGILTDIKMKLNMSGEKLCADLEKVMVNSLSVNTTRDYVSSVYFDSSAEIKCTVPSSKIFLAEKDLPSSYKGLKDQYGALITEKLFNLAKDDANQRYFYF